MDAVTVWLVHTDQPRAVVERLGRLLDVEERRRAAGMPDPVRRSRFVVAHGAMRELVGARLGTDPATVRWERGPNGKPEPVTAGDLRSNLSTCAHLALVAVSRGRGVGVDIEPVPADRVALRLAARHFPASQVGYVTAVEARAADRFATLWSRKEACVKAVGGRLAEGMPLAVSGLTPLAVPYSAAAGTVRVDDLPAPAGHRAAVCLAGTDPFRVRTRIWPHDDFEEA